MLSVLFGNKTATLVLLFLARNGKAYPTEISQGFDIPVNMIQKQLNKFELAEFVVSEISGKRKLYKFNTAHPLYQPLIKMLLRANEIYGEDPADGTHLSVKERLKISDSLEKESEKIARLKNKKAFVISFETFKSYEAWRKKRKAA